MWLLWHEWCSWCPSCKVNSSALPRIVIQSTKISAETFAARSFNIHQNPGASEPPTSFSKESANSSKPPVSEYLTLERESQQCVPWALAPVTVPSRCLMAPPGKVRRVSAGEGLSQCQYLHGLFLSPRHIWTRSLVSATLILKRRWFVGGRFFFPFSFSEPCLRCREERVASLGGVYSLAR